MPISVIRGWAYFMDQVSYSYYQETPDGIEPEKRYYPGDIDNDHQHFRYNGRPERSRSPDLFAVKRHQENTQYHPVKERSQHIHRFYQTAQPTGKLRHQYAEQAPSYRTPAGYP